MAHPAGNGVAVSLLVAFSAVAVAFVVVFVILVVAAAAWAEPLRRTGLPEVVYLGSVI